MVTVQATYTKVCNVLLEPSGLQLGLVTLQEFLDYTYTVIQDFLSKTGLVKKISCVTCSAGTIGFVMPDWILDGEEVFYNDTALEPGSQRQWDLTFPGWRKKISYPQYWAEDQLNPKQFISIPQAALNGDQVALGVPGGFYGTLSAATAGTITVTVSGPWYGTISSATGDVYTETAGPFFGTIGTAVASPTNFAIIGTTGVFEGSLGLNSVIEGMPDSFTLYIAYGVLARIFSKDGEQKDDQRAAYCASRYEEGVMMGKLVSQRRGSNGD